MSSLGWTDYVSMMGSFVVVLLLLRGTLIMIKRMGPKVGMSNSKKIQILEAQNLGGRQKLILVGVGQETILLGLSATGMTKLGQFPNDTDFTSHDEDRPEEISQTGFQSILSRVLNK